MAIKSIDNIPDAALAPPSQRELISRDVREAYENHISQFEFEDDAYKYDTLITKGEDMEENTEKVIGLIYRFGNDDYQINITEFTPEELEQLDRILQNHENDSSCERGNAELSIKDANIDYWERGWNGWQN